ncbi:MAG: signal peptidase I [Coriobacteriaceae bacterium]|nr:signal peptidase I [Coriobacteriaceae bacterium]
MEEEEPTSLARDERGAGVLRTVLEFVIIIVVALVLAWLIKTFIVQPYEIPSGSMLETIQLEDRVLSEKITLYGNSMPERGEIITFTDPEDFENPDVEDPTTLIKRVIAVAGDTIDLRDGEVYVNGEKQDEPYTLGKPTEPLNNDLGITYPYTVPEDCVWAMGDNRTNSSDSRYFGPVSVKSITGHAFWIYWPINHFGSLK